MFHPTSIAPGTVFGGDFRVERPLAMGGMGAVYVAEQLSTGRKRALKLLLLPPDRAQGTVTPQARDQVTCTHAPD